MMKSNYKVKGTIGFFMNDVLHTCLEYETAHQRSLIIQDFMDKVKNIKYHNNIHYIITIDEESIRFPAPQRNRAIKKVIPISLIRPKPEYSNIQYNDL